MALPTRRFGRTELEIPLLSLGGMRFQQSWTDLPPDEITPASQRISRRLKLKHEISFRNYFKNQSSLPEYKPQIEAEKKIFTKPLRF